jgi:hypothetical protein
MPNAYGRAFTTANFLSNLADLKAINFGASDPSGVWFVVPNASTNNIEIWVWQPDSIIATDEISVIRPDSIVPGSPGRCIQQLKFDASSLGGILSAIAALNTAGLIERTAGGSAAIVGLGALGRSLLGSATDTVARSTLGLGTAATRAIGTTTGTVRDAADTAYSNARTPTVHASTHNVGGTDPITVFGYLAVSANTTLTTTNQRQLIDVNATSAAITITLPAAATVGSGWVVQIRKSDASTNLVTISRAGSDTINGATTLPLAVQHQSFILFSLGSTSWGVMGTFSGTLPANTLWGRGATAGPPEPIASSNFASLVNGFVPASQIPGSYDDVLEFANLSSFPVTGEAGKIYIAIDTNLTYRWTGSVYAGMSSSLALGTNATTAYRGDFGNTAYLHSQETGNPHGTTAAQIGLPNLTNHLQVNTTQNQTVGGEKTFTNIVRITNTTQSTSTTNGAQIISGGQAIQGNLWVGGTINQTTSYSFRAAASVSQVIPNATFTKVIFNSKVLDTNNQYDTTLSRLTAITTEIWRITLFVTFNLAASTRILLTIYKNGAETNGVRVLDNQANIGFFAQSITVPEISLVAGDYLEIFCYTSPSQTIYGETSLITTYWFGKRIN